MENLHPIYHFNAIYVADLHGFLATRRWQLSAISDGAEFLRDPKDLWIFQVARILCQKPGKREWENAHAVISITPIFLDLNYHLLSP